MGHCNIALIAKEQDIKNKKTCRWKFATTMFIWTELPMIVHVYDSMHNRLWNNAVHNSCTQDQK